MRMLSVACPLFRVVVGQVGVVLREINGAALKLCQQGISVLLIILLDVLRHGVELLGVRQPLPMAQFKPASGINPDILTRYGANRLRVVRQVRAVVRQAAPSRFAFADVVVGVVKSVPFRARLAPEERPLRSARTAEPTATSTAEVH